MSVMSLLFLFWLAVLAQAESVLSNQDDIDVDTTVGDEPSLATVSHDNLRRRLKTVSLDIPDNVDDWIGIVAAIVILWILLCCLCNAVQCLWQCLGCGGNNRRSYAAVPNAMPRSMYYDSRPPAYNPDYRPMSRRPDNTCRNLALAACCFECCCRDNQDVDCCEICCCLCVYEMCCRGDNSGY